MINPVLANGSIETAEDAVFLRKLGTFGVMIGRAAIKNPWIFRQFVSPKMDSVFRPVEDFMITALNFTRHLSDLKWKKEKWCLE